MLTAERPGTEGLGRGERRGPTGWGPASCGALRGAFPAPPGRRRGNRRRLRRLGTAGAAAAGVASAAASWAGAGAGVEVSGASVSGTHGLGGEGGLQPMAVRRELAAGGKAIGFAQTRGQRAGTGIANRAVVHMGNRQNLNPGAAEKDLVADVELAAIHRALDHLKAELVARELDNAVAGDAFENVVGDRRGDQRQHSRRNPPRQHYRARAPR